MIEFHPYLPSFFILLVTILFPFFLYKYFINVINSKSNFLKFAFILRLLSLLLLYIILLNPVFLKNKEITESESIAFIVDNSKSMSYAIDKEKIIDYHFKINDFLKAEDINYQYYLFGDSLREITSLKQIDFLDLSTDINNLLDNLDNFKNKKIIFISDGVQNNSMLNFSNIYNKRIFSFGVGDENEHYENIALDSLKIDNITSDSIFLRLRISSHLRKAYEGNNIYISNSKHNNLNISSLNFTAGVNNFYHDFSLDNSLLSNENVIFIKNIPNEFGLNDNYIKLTLDQQYLEKKNILLLSGRLSKNTSYIKKILSKYANISINHKFLSNNIEQELYKANQNTIIVFDSFPVNQDHLDLIKKFNIIDNFKVIFFQGPTLEDDTYFLNEFSNSLGYKFVYNNKIVNKQYFELSNTLKNVNIGQIAPIDISTSVLNLNEPYMHTDLNNTLIDINENLFFFIENMTSLSNETLKAYKYNNFDYLVDYYLKQIIYENDNFGLSLYLNQLHPIINKEFSAYLDLSDFKLNDFSDIDLIVLNKNGQLVSRISDYKVSSNRNIIFDLSIENPGQYFIKSELKLNEGKTIETSAMIISVHIEDNEIEHIYLNRANLESISLKSNGQYFMYDELLNYINTLKSNSSIMLKLMRYNIFNFQFFWFVILLFLICEWFIRKNKGLL